MKVLELNFERSWRGGERQTLYDILGFKASGIQVAVLCRKGCPLEAAALEAGVEVYAFSNTLQVLWFLMTKGRRFDIHHAQTSHILTYTVFTKWFHGAKVVFSRRVSFKPKGLLTKLKYNLTDKIVAISGQVSRTLKDFGVQDVAVIPDKVVGKDLNTERAKQLLDEFGISGKRIIGTVAMLTDDKDPLTLVAAIKNLYEQRQDFAVLHFGTGKLEDVVREKIVACGLQDVYKLAGFKEDIEDYFSIFDVFVLSSLHEGLGSSILDAFIYKVPVVATDAGGIPELLNNGRGVLCKKGSAQSLTEGLQKVLADDSAAREMSDAAHEYVIYHHGMEYITGKYLEVFRAL